jgi:hypothetical protein
MQAQDLDNEERMLQEAMKESLQFTPAKKGGLNHGAMLPILPIAIDPQVTRLPSLLAVVTMVPVQCRLHNCAPFLQHFCKISPRLSSLQIPNPKYTCQTSTDIGILYIILYIHT